MKVRKFEDVWAARSDSAINRAAVCLFEALNPDGFLKPNPALEAGPFGRPWHSEYLRDRYHNAVRLVLEKAKP